MNFSGLFGKPVTDVIGIGQDATRNTQPSRLQCRVCVRGGDDILPGCCLRILRSGIGGTRMTQVQAWRTELLGDGGVATHRASHQPTRELAREVILRPEPAFKSVRLRALKIQYFHDDAIIRP